MNEKNNTKKHGGCNCGYTLYSNPQYMTSEVCIVGYIIIFGWENSVHFRDFQTSEIQLTPILHGVFEFPHKIVRI